jgi:tRNA A37 methylthiotransferase MiaB
MDMNGQKKSFFVTLSETGCYSSMVDLRYFSNLLESNNYHQVAQASNADLILVSTCVAAQETEDISVQLIATIIKERKPEAQLIVCGCMAQIYKGKLMLRFPDQISGFYGPRETDTFIEHLNLKPVSSIASFYDQKIGILSPQTRGRQNIFRSLKYINRLISLFSKRTGAHIERLLKTILFYAPNSSFIQIAKGCTGNCTYCIIKRARGMLVSRPIDEIVREIKQALQKGYTHFVLVADDFASYGIDIGTDYPTMLRHILEINRTLSISLCNVNPSRFMVKLKEFLEVIQPGRILNIEYTVQHGSNRILASMKRSHTIEAYIESIRAIHKVDPDITIKSHLLVGFPGESAVDFQENLRLLDRVMFDKLGIFKYSDRPGTPASTFTNKIPYLVKMWRQVRLKTKYFVKQAWYFLSGRYCLKK